MKPFTLFLLLAVLVGCASDPRGSTPPGDPRPESRRSSSGATTLSLSQAQLDEYDSNGTFTPTPEQADRLRTEAGIAPSFLDIDYKTPDGERAELGYNIAIRTGRFSVSVPHRFILSDEELRVKRAHNQWMTGWPRAHQRAAKDDYQYYMIDSDGKYWMWVSADAVSKNLSKHQDSNGSVKIRTPTATLNKDTFASEDKLRQFRRECTKLGIHPYHIYR